MLDTAAVLLYPTVMSFGPERPVMSLAHERRLRMGLKLSLDTPGNPPWSHSATSTPTLVTTPSFHFRARTPTSLSAVNTPASPSTHLDILNSLTLKGSPAGTPINESTPSLFSSTGSTGSIVASPSRIPGGPKAYLPEELAKKMQKRRRFLIVDCRPEFLYKRYHIRGAVNVGMNDRGVRRRLQQSKGTSIADVMASREAKLLYSMRVNKEIIVYDENSTDWTNLPPVHPLQILLSSLRKDGKEPAVLIGGFIEFRSQFPELCTDGESNSLSTEDTLGPLRSPTRSPQGDVELEKVELTQILDFLYLGNEHDAKSMQRLSTRKITHVLNVTSHAPCYFEKEGIYYKRLPASDSTSQDLMQYFNEAFEFIDEARKTSGNVLIHCQAGVSRSATIAVAYVMHHRGISSKEAYDLVKNRRGVIAPNINFMGQLELYEKQLRGLRTPSDTVLPSPSGSQGRQQRILSYETSL